MGSPATSGVATGQQQRSSSSPVQECKVRLTSDSLHDLLSPVNQICSMSELLLHRKGDSLDADTRVLLEFIEAAAQRLRNIAEGFRTYMRVAGAETCPHRCDCNGLLEGALSTLQPLIEHHQAAISSDRLPEIWCDSNQIMAVFASLIENAIKFRREVRPEIHVSSVENGEEWIFSVEDNGIGIDSRFTERAFAMFKRLDTHAPASPGIGLALSKQIVEQHGGRIWVESQPGVGSKFFFSLPRAS